MSFVLGFVTLLVALLLLNVIVYFPFWVIQGIHLPQWLLIGAGLGLFAWFFGDDQGDRPI